MMPSTHSIQVAVKYANKLRKMALTERLTAIGRKKLDEEEEGVEEDDDDFENMRAGNVIYSSVYTSLGNNTNNTTGYSFSGSQDMFGTTINHSSSDLGILAGINQYSINCVLILFIKLNEIVFIILHRKSFTSETKSRN